MKTRKIVIMCVILLIALYQYPRPNVNFISGDEEIGFEM